LRHDRSVLESGQAPPLVEMHWAVATSRMPPVTLMVPVPTWPPAPPWALVELPPAPPTPGELPAPPSFQTDMIELESPEQPANTSNPVTETAASKRIIHLQE